MPEKKDKKEKKDDGYPADPDLDFGEKKKKDKKEKKSKDSDEDDAPKEKKEKKEKKQKRKPTPLVCKVSAIKAVPKNSKLRECTVCFMDDHDPVSVVTNAPNVCEGGCFIVALPGVKTATGIEVEERTVGGVESFGMFCGPKEMGWETDILDPEQAIELEESAEIGTVPTYDEALAALREREKREASKAEAAKADAAKGKKDKGKKGKADPGEDEDLDALLAEAGLEVQDSAPDPKKKGKKGKAAAKQADDDDFDAALNELKSETPDAEVPEAAAASSVEPAEGGAPAVPVEEDAKTRANRLKKEKKKAKLAVGGAGFYKDDDETADASQEVKDAAPAAAPAAKKGAAPKKESAAVKAARERMEEQRRLEEERRAFEEAERKRIEEEERIEREEEEKLEAERQRKRDARAAKIQRQKDEGTYQTKAQKLKAQRAAQLREQFGFVLEEDEDEEGKADAKPAPKRAAPAASKKKKKQQKQEEEADEAPAAEAEKIEEPKEEEKAPTTEAQEEEDDGDDWEAAAEKAEANEAAAADAKGSDDEDEDSDSDDSSSSSSDSSDFLGYRSPIVVIMGHVDTGKTKLLDKIRRTNVQEGEAGGITQQIGATFFPDIALEEQTKKVDPDFELELPGLLIIDTPGHESFNNLRKRGSSLCDFAILVVDIMHGLEPQTVESLDMLRKRRCPFIIAMNKIDVCYSWNSEHYTSIKTALDRQGDSVQKEFKDRMSKVMLQLNERGINCAPYWENTDLKSTVSIVPTSALTGEGVPDLLYMILNLSQNLMASNLEVSTELQCTVIEVKNIEGHGTTIDVVLVNGSLSEGDTIVLAGMGGPIVTQIRALLTPAPMKEMRVKSEYVHHAKIDVSMGVKISAPGLDAAVAGTELKILGPDDDLEELKEEVQDGFESILADMDKQTSGVYVKTSTLGSLEALLSFLADMKIPVFDVGIGEVHKKDVKRATVMKEKGHPEYAVILAFDVKVSAEANQQAAHDGVQIMTADIIYHLFDKFTQYMKQIQDSKKSETRQEAVFPAVLEIEKEYIFRKKDPLILGCKVVGGQLRIGTPICVPEKEFLEIGRVAGIEKDKKECKIARRGESVCVKIEQTTAQNHITYGRHFDHLNKLYTKISRSSIDTLKEHFKDEMKKEDWELIIGMKTVFKIQ